ncbi:MAG: hypothetical protein LBV42_03000 [Methanobrevibacter sp.]|jgi:hypothetical protein|nr:hypothetical protein [Methanobrevibacter sp.]
MDKKIKILFLYCFFSCLLIGCVSAHGFTGGLKSENIINSQFKHVSYPWVFVNTEVLNVFGLNDNKIVEINPTNSSLYDAIYNTNCTDIILDEGTYTGQFNQNIAINRDINIMGKDKKK